MMFFLLKIVCMLIVVLLFCLPFFPRKFRFSLAALGYDGADRWKNLLFVIETGLLVVVFLSLAPLINGFFNWFFELGAIKWLIDQIPGRVTYVINVVKILASNLLSCLVFFVVKNVLRRFLDKKVFKQSASNDRHTANDKKKRPAKPRTDDSTSDRSEKRLRLLRRLSVLVFNRGKVQEDPGVVVSDYTLEKPKQKSAQPSKSSEPDEDEGLSLFELCKKLWYQLIDVFYSKDDNYEFVKVGTYRWAKELKIFTALVSLLYIAVCLLIQIPAWFSFDAVTPFYSFASWLIDNINTYPLLSLILLYELVWFLDGSLKETEEADAPFVTFIDSLRKGKSLDLSKVHESLLKKYSRSYRIKHFDASSVGGSSTYELDERPLAVQNMARAIRASRGFINGDYMQSIEYMFEGKHVLFDSALYSALGEYIMHYLFVTLSFGKRVLFICKDKKEAENAAAYLEAGFRHITKTPRILWRISTFDKLHEGEKPDILILTPEQFLARSLFVDGKSFFEELVDVFVLDADQILVANNYYCLIMAKKLEKATSVPRCERTVDTDLSVETEKRIRYRFFSNGHVQALSNSLRQFFNLEDAPLEAFHSFGLASKSKVSIWHTGLSSTLYVDNGANQVALEVQIAKDVSSFGVSNINLISDTAVYSSQVNEIQGLTLNSCDLSDNPFGFVIVADDCFNLPSAIYNYSRFSGREASVLHVISKPYLLRDYFTAKAEDYVTHFELIGRTISEHAQARRANIIILLCDAVNGIEKSLFIKRATELLDETKSQGSCPCEDLHDLDKCVKLCYAEAFGTESDYEPQYTLEKEQDSELETKTFVHIKDSEQLFERLLECTKTVRLEYINTQSVEYLPIFKDEITQHFIPGQVVVKNNHAYTIKDMSVETGTLILDDTGPSINVPTDYIQTRQYHINGAQRVKAFGHDYRTRNSVVTHVDFGVYAADVTVDTVGYYSIEKAVQTVDLAKPNFAKYINLSGDEELLDKTRREIKTNLLVVELALASPNDARATYSLSVILHEFMKTVFPHQYRCISVCPLFDDVDEEEFFANETAVRDLYPRIIGELGDTDKSGENASTSEGGRLRFAIIEDIQGGNGVVETLIDGNGIMVTNLLHVAADFLAWLQSPAGAEYDYLRFGYDQMPAVFDVNKLEETIRQFRHDVERSELIRRYSENACFFCHRELEEEQGQQLEDGRVICQDCIESSVSTFEELDACLAAVLGEIKNNTSAADTFPADIRVDFVSTTELRRRYGEREDALPIAYCDHTNNVIYIEYGLPKAAACGAVARMITQLWQDRNIINDGSSLFKAHLDLVELQVLFGLKHKAQAEILSERYEGSDGLSELREALREANTEDSFAYFLGVSGKAHKKGEGKDEGKDEGIAFIAERDPSTLPRFCRDHLDEDEKAVYDQICESLHNHADSTGPLVREIQQDRCAEILKMVLNDNPDIFWCANPPASISVDSLGIAKNILFKYCMATSEVNRRKKQVEKTVKPFLKGIKESMSDYEVALRVHENIVSLIDYDSIGLDLQEQDSDRFKKPDNLRSVYGVFVEKKAVCAGYARAYQYMLNRLGIECAYVSGVCHDGGRHAWSIIKLEGDYYYVDVTFDDSSNTDQRKNRNAEVSYDYFAITTEELLRSRTIDNAELYPICTAVKCNYFVRSGLYLTGYDAQKIQKMIVSALRAGKSEIAFKAESAAVLAVIEDRLIKEQGIFDILKSVEEGKSITAYTYYKNEDLNILHIILQK